MKCDATLRDSLLLRYTRAPPSSVGTPRWTGVNGRGHRRIPKYMTSCSTSDRSQPRPMKPKHLHRCFCTQGSASAVVRDSAPFLYSLPWVPERFHLLPPTHSSCGKSAFVFLCVTLGEYQYGLSKFFFTSSQVLRGISTNPEGGVTEWATHTSCLPKEMFSLFVGVALLKVWTMI